MQDAVQYNKQNLPRKPKTLYSLDSPYTPAQWPVLALQEQEEILDVLSELLSPIGRHRSQNIVPSKGQRHTKRKRAAEGQRAQSNSSSLRNDSAQIPEQPRLLKYITVGFNSTNRYLESLATRPAKIQEQESVDSHGSWLDAVFVERADQQPILHAHLPLLIKAASLANPSKAPIRLVSLPSRAEQRLSAALKVPRVGIIGLLDQAPGADALLGLVRTKVSIVEVPWLHEATAGHYMPVEIRSIETTAPVRERPKGSRRHEVDEKE